MDLRALKLATRVINQSNRERPADSVLRSELKAQENLPRDMGRIVSRTVFSYYRWLGWLDRKNQKLADQIAMAVELADRYAQDPNSFSDEELMAKAVPAWLADQTEVTPQLVRAIQAEPVLWLRAKRGLGPAVAAKLGDCEIAGEGILADSMRYRGLQDLYRTEPFQAGEFELQNIHSQAVAWLCNPRRGEAWWDACAGEGGKLLHLSDLMRNKGLIWATDRLSARLKRLKYRAARAKVFNYRATYWDGGPKLPPELPLETKFDGVLLDAPCTNIGTWQRNPHARWTATPGDVQDLAALQRRLLSHVAPMVKPGGKLVYAVCTLTRAETAEVVAAFQAQFPDFKPLSVPDPFGVIPEPSAQHRFQPYERGGNGMFVALWQRDKPAPPPEAAAPAAEAPAPAPAGTPPAP
jgi:16S rRNA (cytosine967-C5)-methyltransferase